MTTRIHFIAFDNETDIVVKVNAPIIPACYFKFKNNLGRRFRWDRIRNSTRFNHRLKNRIIGNIEKILEWRPKGQELEFFATSPLWMPSGKKYMPGEYVREAYGILYITGNVATFTFWYQGQKYKYVENVNFVDATKIVFQGSVDKK